MKHIKLKYKIFGAVVLVIFLLLFFLSSLVKNWIVNNSQELIGRKIALNELHFNYFKVSLSAKDFVMFETDKVDSFASFDELYINFDPLELISNEYSFSQITLVNPRVYVSQNIDGFNFDDFLQLEDSVAEAEDSTNTASVRFTIRNLEMKRGYLVYEDLQVNNEIELNDLNLSIPMISWDSRQSNMGINFRMGETGEVNISAQVDNQNKKYLIDLNTKTISIEPVKSYLSDYLDVSYLGGFLSSAIKINGELDQVMNLSISGNVTVDSLLIKDGQNNNLIAADKIETNISSIDLYSSKYFFSSVIISNPEVTAQLDRDMSNFERAFQPYLMNDSIIAQRDSVAVDPISETPVTYRIDTIQIINGKIGFTDNTLNRPFTYNINDIAVKLTGLTESSTNIPVTFSMSTNNNGNISGTLLLNMSENLNLALDMKIRKLGLLSFSPYSEYFIASPITQGVLDYDISVKMTPSSLINKNTIRLEELEFGKKTRDSTAVKAPVKLALYILKDPNDIISFDLPVEGNPSDPHFSYTKILWKAIANFFVKTAAAPFNALAGLVGANSESLEKLPFEYAQNSLDQDQENILSKIALLMQKKPELHFRFEQFTDLVKEKQALAVQMAQREYIVSSLGSTADSSQIVKAVDDLSSSDKDFLSYLRLRNAGIDSLEIGDVCVKLYNSSELDEKLSAFIIERNTKVNNYLTGIQNVSPEKIEVLATDFKNIPDELRFPHFKIEVSIK